MRGSQEQQIVHHPRELGDQLAAVRAGRGMPQGSVALLAVGDPDGTSGASSQTSRVETHLPIMPC